MKKSLIALAVAGVFAAPAAFAATGNVDVYGIMNVAIEQADCLGAGCADDALVTDNSSRIGFKGSEDLGGGLKAIWQIESGLSGASPTPVGTGGALASRNTFVGLSGGFGTVLIGRHDVPYKLGTGSLDIFGDTIADYNSGRLNGVQGLMNAHDRRDGQAVAYISPTFSGFHAAIAAVMTNGGAGTLSSPGDNFDAISMTGVYVNGPLFGSLSYQSVEADLTTLAGVQDSDAWKVGLGYTFGDAKVGVIYENVELGTASSDRHTWILNGVYNMGPIALKAQYGDVSNAAFGAIANDDQKMWAIGADYSLSKRTTAYLVYGNGDSDALIMPALLGTAPVGTSAVGDIGGWNLGLKHSF